MTGDLQWKCILGGRMSWAAVYNMMVWNYHLWKSKGEQFYSAVENMTLGKKAKTNAGHYSLIKKIIVKVLYINTDARFWGCWIKKKQQ